MSSFQKVLMLGLLCAAAQAVEVQIFSKEFVDEPLESGQYSISPSIDQHLMYILCNKTGWFNEATCHLKRKVINGTDKHCIVKLKGHKEGDLLKFHHLESMLGGSKAVLEWYLLSEGATITQHLVRIVDMNNCNSNPTTLKFNSYPYVLVYHDSLHAYVPNENMLCGERNSHCIFRYDHKGQQDGKPVAIHLENHLYIEQFMVADRLNSSSGVLFTTINSVYKTNHTRKCLMKVSHVSHEGFVTVFLNNHELEGVHCTIKDNMLSNKYGHLSLCYFSDLPNMCIHCMQYDANRGKKIDTVFLMEKKSNEVLKVFSQRQGGMIILYVDCDRAPFGCINSHLTPYPEVKFKEVGVNGSVIRNIELTGVRLDYNPLSYEELSIDHLETDTKHCFIFATTPKHKKNQNSLKYLKACVDKFVKKIEEKQKRVNNNQDAQRTLTTQNLAMDVWKNAQYLGSFLFSP